MRISDVLISVGYPVAYYPRLAIAVGGNRPGIFLCQMLYWYGKGNDMDGWVWKNSDEIENETGLSYDEQVTARKQLCNLGILEEKYDRLRHQMAFRLNLDALEAVWQEAVKNHPEWQGEIGTKSGFADFSENRNSVFPNSDKTESDPVLPKFPKTEKRHSGMPKNGFRESRKTAFVNLTETTTENTTETTEINNNSGEFANSDVAVAAAVVDQKTREDLILPKGVLQGLRKIGWVGKIDEIAAYYRTNRKAFKAWLDWAQTQPREYAAARFLTGLRSGLLPPLDDEELAEKRKIASLRRYAGIGDIGGVGDDTSDDGIIPGSSDAVEIDEKYQQAWTEALERLRSETGKAVFDTWVRHAVLMAHRDGRFVVAVRNAYARDWLESRLGVITQRILSDIMGAPQRVEFVVAEV